MPAKTGRKFALDTNVVVAALSSWHEHHRRAARAIDSRLKAGWSPVIPSNVLLETFAVLTRLPAPFRIEPRLACQALLEFLPEAAASITPHDCFQAMGNLARFSLAGGKVYDAAIAECAVRCGASVLLTFDSDFSILAGINVEIEVPA